MNTTSHRTVRNRLAAAAVACAILATPVALSESASAATMPRPGTSTTTQLPALASKALCKKVAAALGNPNNSNATNGVYVNFLLHNCKATWW